MKDKITKIKLDGITEIRLEGIASREEFDVTFYGKYTNNTKTKQWHQKIVTITLKDEDIGYLATKLWKRIDDKNEFVKHLGQRLSRDC